MFCYCSIQSSLNGEILRSRPRSGEGKLWLRPPLREGRTRGVCPQLPQLPTLGRPVQTPESTMTWDRITPARGESACVGMPSRAPQNERINVNSYDSRHPELKFLSLFVTPCLTRGLANFVAKRQIEAKARIKCGPTEPVGEMKRTLIPRY